jgi:4a-hydroxytetrahydrobiopterin dehydratase
MSTPSTRRRRPNLLADLPGWQIDATGVLLEGVQLQTAYTAAILFVNIARRTWLSARITTPISRSAMAASIVRYSTHDVGGLSRNDFVCAAKVEALARI